MAVFFGPPSLSNSDDIVAHSLSEIVFAAPS